MRNGVHAGTLKAIHAVVVILTLAPIGYLAVRYAGLPDSIPVHWNIHGEVDRWQHKSLLAVFFPGILAAGIQLLLGMITQDLVRSLDRSAPGSEEAEDYRRRSIKANLDLLQPTRVILGGLISLISLTMALEEPGSRAPQWWSWSIGVTVGCLLIVSLIGAIRIMRLQRKWEAAASGSAPELQAVNWRWGGAFYNNPADPEVMVHKRIGAGFTINFAHPRGKLYVVLFFAIISFVTAAVIGVK